MYLIELIWRPWDIFIVAWAFINAVCVFWGAYTRKFLCGIGLPIFIKLGFWGYSLTLSSSDAGWIVFILFFDIVATILIVLVASLLGRRFSKFENEL
ncbi:hypothetical protein [Aggregatibacter actinomycetemcomitans]|uniref:hypothetical protein n=1 Tax=Aggregatibacter actinomycetemcomitans TaxID=714 RepID=UPI0005180135|nr:hypothetical protein [Aggregatibacter actinomycetemcomitans]KYK72624.1 hypothetical protein SA3096_09555 [Aggregatibacter actinomycetemcomitans serotype e str. SA3096]KYK78713.1 hypothetical protein SC936_09120 [Aggregatibacter actinomycetemcomitans serotype e str. SC936]